MPPRKSIITIKDVAADAGLSLATVSYALRNDPKIPACTRTRVQAVARNLGYRPNPRVASLMAHIRGARKRAFAEHIAFVWVHTSPLQSGSDPFLRQVFQAARERAEQAGFALEEFWTSERGMTDRRLEQIIRARGIIGVVLSPVTTDEATITLDWDWGSFAAAVIGNVTWTPELHHAGHHHYLGMRMALRELANLGCKRPAALIEHETNERAKRAWEAAFLTHHPTPSRARALTRVIRPDETFDARAWLAAQRPDALIVSSMTLFDTFRLRAACRDLNLPAVTLHWNDGTRGVGGIDQCYDRIAAHAVDLVIAQLNSNEIGVPDLPRIMLFQGRWVAPRSPIGPRARTRIAHRH